MVGTVRTPLLGMPPVRRCGLREDTSCPSPIALPFPAPPDIITKIPTVPVSEEKNGKTMTTVPQRFKLLLMPTRVQIVEDLWEYITQSALDLPGPQWQKGERARRKKGYLQRRNFGETWDFAKESWRMHSLG